MTGPVIFVTVVVGIASLGSLARAGGLALRTLGYFFTMTVIALAPGADAQSMAQESIKEAGGEGGGFVGFITNSLLPDSFLGPFVENEILKVLVIAIVTAAAISFLEDGLRTRVVSVFEASGSRSWSGSTAS